MRLLPAERMIGTSLILSNSNNYSKQIYWVEWSIARISISTNGYLSKILGGRQHKMAVLAAFFCDELRCEKRGLRAQGEAKKVHSISFEM